MAQCQCGRQFKSVESLAQHQAAKSRNCNAASTWLSPRTTKAPQQNKMSRSDGFRLAWMWNNVKSRTPICAINSATLKPAPVPVKSTPNNELVCSYSWQNCSVPIINVPGTAPTWQPPPLPITLPRDKGTYFVDQSASRVPQHRFEPLMRAVESMNAAFRFDSVDIVCNRNSLRKLLDFCSGRAKENFRVNLMLVHNTLFIERCERSVRELIRGTQNSGWGHSFEQSFTKFPPGIEGTTGYHRALKYPLGNLRCVVQFEMDAFYNKAEEGSNGDGDDPVSLPMARLSLKDPPANKTREPSTEMIVMPQSLAAEIKALVKSRSVGKYMPQLWFGRTPWLITGRHREGTFYEANVIDASAKFSDWESSHQDKLQKLVTILTELREAVRQNGGRHCIAIHERSESPGVLQIFPSQENRRPIPKEYVVKFWT